jgi:hypothetical protein
MCFWRFRSLAIWQDGNVSEGMTYCLAEFWALNNIQGTKEPDRRLFALLRDLLNCNNHERNELHLIGPYYSLEQAVRWKYRFFLQTLRSHVDRDDHYRRSWFAEPLFHLLVRRNYKSACKVLWPDVTRFLHMRTRLPRVDAFGPTECDEAISEERVIDTPRSKTWNEAVADAVVTVTPMVPAQLLNRPALLLLYCLFVPQRMDRDVVLWLDRQFCKSWY